MKFLSISICCIVVGLVLSNCSSKKTKLLQAKFDYGDIKIAIANKSMQQDEELALVTRFELNKKITDGDIVNYFQYHLGKKIKIVIGNDTIAPSLFYYVPLIDDKQKEIDLKFRIEKNNREQKRIIINDSILGFEKVNILIK